MKQLQSCRFPAEWETHCATWLSYPHQLPSFPDNFEKALEQYVAFAALISKSERVCLNVPDEIHQEKASRELEAAGAALSQIGFFIHRTDDVWCRDHGGIFMKNDKGNKLILDWQFNAWGGKYPHENDKQIAQKMAKALGLPRISIPMILEGGAIENNGAGTLLTTEACLLNANRNSRLSKSEIEQILKEHFRVHTVIWLGDGIVGDDTDGHIDDMTRFVSEQRVVTALGTNPEDENFAPLQENHRRLQETDLEIVTLPMPKPVFDVHGDRLPASYANYCLTNDHVIVPTFKCPQDEEAISILQEQFPTRKAVGLRSDEIIAGFGSFHCLSQQEPI